MVKREELFKWIAYIMCNAVLLFLCSLSPNALKLWGVLPFLPPVLLACVASLEDLRPATIYGLIFGVFCDLSLSAPFPCLYTISFTVSALFTAYLASTVFQNYFLRIFSGTVLTFFLTDLLCMLALAVTGSTAFFPMLSLAARETAASLPLLAVYPLFVLIRRFFTY